MILSGTGSDGSLGLKAVKEKGGLVIAQSPEEAAYDGMPRSAITTGLVDFVLPVAKIPEILANYGRRRVLNGERKGRAPDDDPPDWLAEIIDLVRTKTAHDFALYKPGTLLRRIERRMAMAAVVDGGRYLDMLRQNSGEIELLAKDVLINVTSFFRDPKAFELLGGADGSRSRASASTADRPLRVWVAGCSTGEETYSIAMLFLEEIAERRSETSRCRSSPPMSMATRWRLPARAFIRNRSRRMSPRRGLPASLLKEEHGYRVVPELRELVVFTTQDVLADPPFSRLDLVSCRNLLIYLRPEAQERVLLLFDFALREGGILFLGGAETVAGLDDRFEPISKTHRIYRHIGRGWPGEAIFRSARERARVLFGRARRTRRSRVASVLAT